MSADPFPFITAPALILKPEQIRKNIRKMAQKAQQNGLDFRPHFKTHQSQVIGGWFREEGINKIAVSSLPMAEYFAQDGWKDICLALPINPREIAGIKALAASTQLSVVVDHLHSLGVLEQAKIPDLGVWIELDCGDGRTGLAASAPSLSELVKRVQESADLRYMGLLSHAGQSYSCRGLGEIQATHEQSLAQIQQAQHLLREAGMDPGICSYGDTPSCSKAKGFEGIHELRPGNFVFFDCMQEQITACEWGEIAVALAAPIISVRPDLGQLTVHGGAVHLSKEQLRDEQDVFYGRVALPVAGGWSLPLDGLRLSKLSQEHGVIKGDPQIIERFNPGELLMILPVHSCLAADLMNGYFLPDGSWLGSR